MVHEPSKALPGKDIVDSSKVVEEKPSELTVVMALEDAAPGKPQKPSNLEILETVAPVAEKGQRIPAIEDGDVGDEKKPRCDSNCCERHVGASAAPERQRQTSAFKNEAANCLPVEAPSSSPEEKS